METRKPLCLEDISKLINALHENAPKFGRQLACSKKVYNKYFRTKLPRKLKKKNKKLGILNSSINNGK
jgi:hypothetical protein